MNDQIWSWVLGFLGVVGFIFAGKKIWWAWYVNIATQFVWFAYAVVTQQWGFFVSSVIYFVVFSKNAYDWTREHYLEKSFEKRIAELHRKFDEDRRKIFENWGYRSSEEEKPYDTGDGHRSDPGDEQTGQREDPVRRSGVGEEQDSDSVFLLPFMRRSGPYKWGRRIQEDDQPQDFVRDHDGNEEGQS